MCVSRYSKRLNLSIFYLRCIHLRRRESTHNYTDGSIIHTDGNFTLGRRMPACTHTCPCGGTFHTAWLRSDLMIRFVQCKPTQRHKYTHTCTCEWRHCVRACVCGLRARHACGGGCPAATAAATAAARVWRRECGGEVGGKHRGAEVVTVVQRASRGPGDGGVKSSHSCHMSA